MVQSTLREREFKFTEKHFEKVRSELYDYAGIVLNDTKQEMAYNRLVRRLRAHSLASFDEYFAFMDRDPAEFTQFINALTTNLTSFFRENHHFEFLRKELVNRRQTGNLGRLRCWSAGCSLGEEPYSIAITMLEAGIDPAQDVEILATDIDSQVLGSAQQGVYPFERVESLSKGLLRKWFLKGKGSNIGLVKVQPVLQQLVNFQSLNLVQEWPKKELMDFIFCRNVMIYFDQPTQQKLLNKFAKQLAPGGYLFVGHSEALARHETPFELVGKTIYRRVAE